MTIERLKEIRDCSTQESIDTFETILDDFSNNHQLKSIPLLIASLTENSEMMELIEHSHHLLDVHISENSVEAIPVFLNNINLAIPDGVPYIGISINGILSDNKDYEILLNSLKLSSNNKEALIEVLNYNIDEYKYLEKHNLFLDLELSKIRLKRTNYLLDLLAKS